MSDEQTDSIIDIDPTFEKRPVLPAGKYGADGEATLARLRAGTVRFGRDAGKPCINMQVRVLTTEHGYVGFFRDWLLEGQAKNATLRMLGQLGLDLASMKDPATGRVRFDGASVEGSKVIAELSYREYDVKGPDGEPTGERASVNDLRNVWKRA